MNLDLYKVFYQTAKAGSITKAAETLFITQPTVSYFIKQLEGELGISLFHRSSKGVSLSKEGEVLFQYVEEAMQALRRGEKKMELLKNLESGEVKVGISETLCKYYLLPTLEKFHHTYPDIRIRLIHGQSYRIVRHLLDGTIDLGMVQLPVEDQNIIVSEIITLQDCFITGQKYRFLTDSRVSLKELIHYPLVSFSEKSNTRHFLISLFQKHGLSILPEIELGNIDLLKEFVRLGFGISLVTRDFVQEELEQKVLFEIKLKEKIPSRKVGIITLKNTPLSFAAKQLIRELHDEGC